MKMKRLTIITAAAALLSLGAKAQTEVTAYTPGLTEDGITYFLPATSLRVVLTATKRIIRQASSVSMQSATCA